MSSTVNATGTADAIDERRSVPWPTVVALAVVLSYADGFWMTSLRGAVGAIERTQSPFTSWVQESTLALPVFALAVLGALTLALRWFGPRLSPKTVVATALLIVAAGTLVGTAEVAASAAYDYHLQTDQLQMMDSMRGTCAGAGCLAQQQQASLALQERAVGVGGGLLLATNLVLVGWAVAMRGGRLEVSTAPKPSRHHLDNFPAHGTRRSDSARRSRVDDIRLLLVAGLMGSAAVHAAVAPEHLTEWAAAGVFFIALAAVELGLAVLLIVRPVPAVLLGSALASICPLVLWLYSRTAGMPFGPEAGSPEPVGLPDGAACLLEIGTLLAAIVLLRGSGWLRRRTPASRHAGGLSLIAVVAITAIGLAGLGPASFDDFGVSGDETVVNPHDH